MADYFDARLYAGNSLSDAKELFKKFVNNVVIETNSRCNRKCSFCVSRMRDNDVFLDSAIFSQLVDELDDIAYGEMVCLQLYNEPLLYLDDLCSKVEIFRRRMPRTYIYFSTNGDLLDKPVLDRLNDCGLSRITISVHPEHGYDDVVQLNAFMRLARRTGLNFRFKVIRSGGIISAESRHKGMEIVARSINFNREGANRGGLLKHIPAPDDRRAPCSRPFHDFVVSYNGQVFPCCNFIAGVAGHEKYVVEELRAGRSIYEVYASSSMARWRKMLLVNGRKCVPCNTCRMGAVLLDEAENTRRVDYLASLGRFGQGLGDELLMAADCVG